MSLRFRLGDRVTVIAPDRPLPGNLPALLGEDGIVQQYDLTLGGAVLYTVLMTTGELEPLYEAELDLAERAS